MTLERAYLYLEHAMILLEHGNVTALRLGEPGERRHYVDAIQAVLPLLVQKGVRVE